MSTRDVVRQSYSARAPTIPGVGVPNIITFVLDVMMSGKTTLSRMAFFPVSDITLSEVIWKIPHLDDRAVFSNTASDPVLDTSI